MPLTIQETCEAPFVCLTGASFEAQEAQTLMCITFEAQILQYARACFRASVVINSL